MILLQFFVFVFVTKQAEWSEWRQEMARQLCTRSRNWPRRRRVTLFFLSFFLSHFFINNTNSTFLIDYSINLTIEL
jgi:di/tricarboxylate transporter